MATLLIGFYAGAELLNISFPRFINPALSKPFFVVGVSVGISLLSWLLGGSSAVQVICACVSIVVGVYALLKVQRGSLVLAWLFFASQVLRANSSILGFLGLGESIYYAIFVTAPVFDIPCLLGYMIAINKRFANKFSDAENLAIHLDEKVTERTQQLEDQQKQKHQLMINVFHDLRSPLFVLKESINLLESNMTTQQRIVPIIKERVAFLQALVDDLFLLAKLEDNKVLFDLDTVNLSELVAGSAARAEIEGNAKATTVSLQAENDCFVDGDARRLTQAIDNIILNAIQYSPEGSHVLIQIHAASKDTVTVSITDNGPGMSADTLSHIFESYYRRGRSGSSTSTGLGLSIAKGIIQEHGGSITATSIPSSGTTFTIQLPLLDVTSSSLASLE